jgi:hypothetical protein
MTERQIVLASGEYTRQLRSFQSDDELRKIQRYFKAGDDDHFIGVRMLHVFTLAKVFIDLAAPNVIGDYLLGRPRGILTTWRARTTRGSGARRSTAHSPSCARATSPTPSASRGSWSMIRTTWCRNRPARAGYALALCGCSLTERHISWPSP